MSSINEVQASLEDPKDWGLAISDLVLAFSMNRMRAERQGQCEQEQRRLVWRRLDGGFWSKSRKCTIDMVF